MSVFPGHVSSNPPARHVPVELLNDRTPTLSTISAAGFTTVEQLYDAVAVQFKLPRVYLDSMELAIELAELIPRELAEKHHVVPVFADANEISLAVSDPTQLAVYDWLGRQLRRMITVVVATPQEVSRGLARLYAVRRAPAVESVEQVSKEDLAAATHVVNAIITGALDRRASDIHVEATEHQTIVRYRVDGVLREVDARPIDLHAAVVSRIKVLAQLDIAIHHAPQDGRVKLRIAGADIVLRVSVLPTYWGEKVVCRVLDNKRAALPLDSLDFDPDHKRQVLKMVGAPYGLVLVTGPTGSGKSTTLYAALNAIRNPELNIITVEDPVEYQLAGINQVQVAPKRGLTFAGALRSILRQDPDVILVGEIRDQETGQLAAEAALTGHLVLSSLHTNDALGSIMRLSELGVEPFLVAPSLLGIVSQRLVRTLCPLCRHTRAPEASELAALDLPRVPEGTRISHPVGCTACHRTGYSGRVAVREVLTIDDELRAMITSRATVGEMREVVIAAGFKTMRFHALRLWLAGRTSTGEVIRATRS